jgi:hypothetical protein
MNKLDEKIVESYLKKYNFFGSAPEMIIFGNFLIVFMALMKKTPLIPNGTTTVIASSWGIICIGFLIYSFIKENSLKKKIVKMINNQSVLIKNVKEVRILKTNKNIHEAKVTFENGETELMELSIVENIEVANDVIEYKKIPTSIYKNRNFTNKIPIAVLSVRNQRNIVVTTTTLAE